MALQSFNYSISSTTMLSVDEQTTGQSETSSCKTQLITEINTLLESQSEEFVKESLELIRSLEAKYKAQQLIVSRFSENRGQYDHLKPLQLCLQNQSTSQKDYASGSLKPKFREKKQGEETTVISLDIPELTF